MRRVGAIALIAQVGIFTSACLEVPKTSESDADAAGADAGRDATVGQPLTTATRSDIDGYIQSLNYDPRQLLSVQMEGITDVQPVRERRDTGGAIIVTTKTQRSLRKNLSDMAILRPTAGVIYPGALVIADRNLMEGQPVPITLAHGKMTISIDLPGLQNARRTLDNATHSSVQDSVTSMLEEWNRLPASQGYVNAARSYLLVNSAYSSQQVALDLGINAKWAGGVAFAQLEVRDGSQAAAAIAYYKQVFYSVTLDSLPQPSQYFADSVTLEDVQRVVGARNPPAYVRSVDYGRVLMVRMDTTARSTRVNLQGALTFALSGGVSVTPNLRVEYEKIIKNGTFSVVAIGGGAQTAAAFSGSVEDLTKLRDYIAKDATYRRDNPGAPISYTVAFMKDNQLATMGFTTDYTQTESVEYPHGFVKLAHQGAYVARFSITWEEPDANFVYMPRVWASGEKTAGYSQRIDLPGDARNVRIFGQAATGLIWDPWGEAINITLPGPTNLCYRVIGTTLNRRWDNQC